MLRILINRGFMVLVPLFDLKRWVRLKNKDDIYLFVDRVKFLSAPGWKQGTTLENANRDDVDGSGVRWDAHFSWGRLDGVPYVLGRVSHMERMYDVWVQALAYSGMRLEDNLFDLPDHGCVRLSGKHTSIYGPVLAEDFPRFLGCHLTDGFSSLLRGVQGCLKS